MFVCFFLHFCKEFPFCWRGKKKKIRKRKRNKLLPGQLRAAPSTFSPAQQQPPSARELAPRRCSPLTSAAELGGLGGKSTRGAGPRRGWLPGHPRVPRCRSPDPAGLAPSGWDPCVRCRPPGAAWPRGSGLSGCGHRERGHRAPERLGAGCWGRIQSGTPGRLGVGSTGSGPRGSRQASRWRGRGHGGRAGRRRSPDPSGTSAKGCHRAVPCLRRTW